MSLNREKDAKRKAATREKIVETGFRVFAERTIDASNLTDVAEAAGVAMTTVYRYFSSKEALVLEIGPWIWKQYTGAGERVLDISDKTGAERFDFFLDSFIDLYRNHKDILRFNQFFNVYVQRESISSEQIRPYTDVVDAMAQRFHAVYEKGKEDGTLRTDIPEREMFSVTLHLMLAVVTRYAVGLVYDGGVDPERELMIERDLLRRACLKNP